MALTQTDLDRLDSAIARSELEVQLDGRRIKYRSVDELMAARAHVAAVLARASGSRSGATFRYSFKTARGD